MRWSDIWANAVGCRIKIDDKGKVIFSGKFRNKETKEYI